MFDNYGDTMKARKKLLVSFPGSYINSRDEFIAHPRTNQYAFYAKDSTQAYERGKEVFVSEFARYGVTAEDFDAEYDIAITSGENVK